MEGEKTVKKEKNFQGIELIGKILLVLCVLFYFAGFFSSNFLEYDLSLQVSSEPLLNTAVLVLGVFFLSIAFYGMLSPVLFFLIGVEHSSMLNENMLFAVKFIPMVLAAYGGIFLGMFLKRDIEKLEMEWKNIAKKVIIIVVIALILALVMEYFSTEIGAIKMDFFS